MKEEKLDQVPSKSLNVACWRAIDLEKYRSLRRPLYSSSAASRLLPNGGPERLYMASELLTAYLEADIRSATSQVSPPTKLLFAATCRAARLLDLADPSTRQLLEISRVEITAPWRHLPGPTNLQKLGQAVYDHGRFQAIRFPSSKAEGGTCVLLFLDRLDEAPSCEPNAFLIRERPLNEI